MSTITVQMTPQELQLMIESAVERVLERKLGKIFDSLDDDGELRPEVRQRLRHQLMVVKAGERGTPLSDVLAQFGLN